MENNDSLKQEPSRFGGRALAVLAVVLFATTAFSLFYLMRERDNVQQLTASRNEAQAAISQTKAQMDDLAARMNNLVAAQAAAEQTRRSADAAKVVRVPARRGAANDPRIKRLQDQLAANQKELAGTKQDLSKAREEMQGKLDSTRDELNASIAKNQDELNSSLSRSHDELSSTIARNHDELVELRKKGERNYYEFDLAKSKQFQKTGPLSLQLRGADAKHKRFDLKMLVDDAQLEKKRVNLYEPVMIYLPDRVQPLELVVNQIDKNRVKGYLSEPKYKKTDAVTTSAAAKQQELTTR